MIIQCELITHLHITRNGWRCNYCIIGFGMDYNVGLHDLPSTQTFSSPTVTIDCLLILIKLYENSWLHETTDRTIKRVRNTQT